jgi:site-specific DNA recombinase
MPAAIYARISDDRKGKNVSIESQLKDCRTFVQEQGWDAVEFVDKNISAFNGNPRGRYLEMLAAAKSGEVDRIVAYDLDRLYRDPRELEDLIALADPRRRKPIHVYDPDGDLNLHTEGGITAARQRVNTANMESRSKSRRVKRAKKAIRESGVGSGGPRPFGWKSVQATDKFGKPAFKNGAPKMIWARDQYEPTEVALIRAAVSDLVKGASLRDVAQRWNAAGVRQPQERARNGWTAAIVHLVVANPRLAGLIGHRRQVMDENGKLRYLPVEIVGKANDLGDDPIVDRATWEQLQEVLKQRGGSGHVPRHRSLLTGLVTCAKCGQTMKRSGTRAGNGDYTRKAWRCYPPANHQGAWTGHASIDATGLEKWLIEATMRIADTTSLAALMRERGRQGNQASELVAKLEELERRLDQAADSHAAGKLPLRAFERTAAEIQRLQRTLQGKLGPLTATATLEPYTGKQGLLRAQWPTRTMDEQRAIIAAILGRVTVSPALTRGRPTFDPARVRISRPSSRKAQPSAPDRLLPGPRLAPAV